MKLFELTIKWDRLRNGNFPSKRLEDIGFTVDIFRERDPFKEVVVVSIITEERNHLEIAYELGATIQTLITK